MAELATRKPDNLCDKIMEINEAKKLVRRLPTLTNIKSWVEQAKKLPGKVEHNNKSLPLSFFFRDELHKDIMLDGKVHPNVLVMQTLENRFI